VSDWLDTLRALGDNQADCALITVLDTRGSTPREAGTRMVVTPDACMGTIGGGQLEFQAVELARCMLSKDATSAAKQVHTFTLGPEMQQCCGGVVRLSLEAITAGGSGWIDALAERRTRGTCVVVSEMPGASTASAGRLVLTAHDSWGSLGNEALDKQATETALAMFNLTSKNGIGAPDGVHVMEACGDMPALLFEVVSNTDFHVMLFGAGHVGKALVNVLSDLPCHIDWVDSRADEFPASIPANVTVRINDVPADEVRNAPAGSFFLVMTHSHPTDFQICKAVLAGEFAYLGLIGSQSKRNRFTKNLVRAGLPPEKTARLTCPIGIAGIRGKHPTAIAIAVAAELLELYEHGKRQAPRPAEQSAGVM